MVSGYCSKLIEWILSILLIEGLYPLILAINYLALSGKLRSVVKFVYWSSDLEIGT